MRLIFLILSRLCLYARFKIPGFTAGLILLYFFCFTHTLFSQVTITIDSLPAMKTNYANEKIFVAGNFNAWNAADSNYILKKNSAGNYSITFTPAQSSSIEFKFTRGSWNTGETAKDGGFKQNRTYPYTPGMQTHEKIENWQDIAPKKNVQPNKDIITLNVFSPELKTNKKIRVYLPPGYNKSKKTYPVVYMMDAQNLFDDMYAYAGEWGIDESIQKLYNEKIQTAIVVGIDNAGAGRMNEYSPWQNEKYGEGKGEAFAQFLAETLKPQIDKKYRTKTERENTYIMGSSMGGLMSLYIVLRYNDVFAKAAVFSPAFWTQPDIFTYADDYNLDTAGSETSKQKKTKIYFYAGNMESEDMVNDMQAVYDLLFVKNLPGFTYRIIVESNGTHTEKFWRTEFPVAYKWLLNTE